MASKFKGVVCEKSEQMGQTYMTRNECLSCVTHSDHPCAYHPKMLSEMWGDSSREPAADTFSPTRVQNICARQTFYNAHTDEYPQLLYPDKAWDSFRGTLIHTFFEDTDPGPGVHFDIAEMRIQQEVQTKYGSVVFAGKPDLVEILRVDKENKEVHIRVVDWKSIKEIKHDMTEAKASHMHQVNMYAWLLYKSLAGLIFSDEYAIIVDELEIFYISMPKGRRFSSAFALETNGKILAPRKDGVHEKVQLKQIRLGQMDKIEKFIVALIEKTIENQQVKAPRLIAEEARICDWCSFKAVCYADAG